ncbi:hypothetical protein CRYUN_Cryun23aG0121900 [Craigia yunnanensis]
MWVTSLTPIRSGPTSPLPYSNSPSIKLSLIFPSTSQPIPVYLVSQTPPTGATIPSKKRERAASQKEKANRKKELASSDASHREKDCLDYRHSNVTPFEIKNEWSLKLDELEKRLQELE